MKELIKHLKRAKKELNLALKLAKDCCKEVPEDFAMKAEEPVIVPEETTDEPPVEPIQDVQ